MNRPAGDHSLLTTLIDAPRRTGEPVIENAVMRETPEDFVVQELPLYEPCGSGEHLYLWIEKRDVSSEQLRRLIADGLQVAPSSLGIAGNKDRRAVTQQYVSVPAAAAPRVADFEAPGLRILHSARHTNKLRTGHLAGNRFHIRLRVSPGSVDEHRCRMKLEHLTSLGFANFYGPQRFGGGETLRLGLDILRGKTRSRLSRSQFRLALSAVQSAVFNDVLTERLRQGTANQVMRGDVLMFRRGHTSFVAEHPPAEQSRLDNQKIVITGPLPGPKMMPPGELAAELEARSLERLELTNADFCRYRKLTPGTRRRLIAWPEELFGEFDDSSVHLDFVLTPGSYATVLLREIVQNLATGPVSS